MIYRISVCAIFGGFRKPSLEFIIELILVPAEGEEKRVRLSVAKMEAILREELSSFENLWEAAFSSLIRLETDESIIFIPPNGVDFPTLIVQGWAETLFVQYCTS